MKLSLHRLICLLLLGAVTFTSIAACSRNIETTIAKDIDQHLTNCRAVQHAMGETCIPQNPQRVITLRPDHLANSLALGIEPIASAFVEGFPFPQDIQNKVGNVASVGDISRPNLEKMLGLKPDLIIASSRLEGIYNDLSHIAPTVVIDMPYPPPSWKEQLVTLAKLLDKEDTSQRLMNDYWQRVKSIKQALGPQREQLEVSVANSSSEYGIWAYGEKHFPGEVLNDIGLQRPSAQRGDFIY